MTRETTPTPIALPADLKEETLTTFILSDESTFKGRRFGRA